MFPCISDFYIVCGLQRALLISPMFSDKRTIGYNPGHILSGSFQQVLYARCCARFVGTRGVCYLQAMTLPLACWAAQNREFCEAPQKREGWANEPINERTYSNSLLSFGTLIHLFSIPCPVACRRIGNGKSSIFVWSLWSLVCSVERVRNSLSVHSPHPQLSGRRKCCCLLALQLAPVPLGEVLACLHLACVLRAPFTALQGYNTSGPVFACSAIVLQSLMLCCGGWVPRGSWAPFTAGLELP